HICRAEMVRTLIAMRSDHGRISRDGQRLAEEVAGPRIQGRDLRQLLRNALAMRWRAGTRNRQEHDGKRPSAATHPPARSNSRDFHGSFSLHVTRSDSRIPSPSGRPFAGDFHACFGADMLKCGPGRGHPRFWPLLAGELTGSRPMAESDAVLLQQAVEGDA